MESGQLDLAAKAAYLAELNRTDPEAVLRHMEQQPQSCNEAVAAEYIRALVKSGRRGLHPTEQGMACPPCQIACSTAADVQCGEDGLV